jgi:hypothetical protein
MNCVLNQRKLYYLQLLLTGNDLNKEGKYSQHKDYAWTGGSIEAVGEENGRITVSLSLSGFFY